MMDFGAAECLDACRLFAQIIVRALSGMPKDEAVLADIESFTGGSRIVAIAREDYRRKTESEIRGSGYMVESLEATLWCFVQTDTFSDAVLRAANLGDDADTTSAVCGQVAGAYYEVQQIPLTWLERLTMRATITELADRLYQAGCTRAR
ncbi:MAG: ADP-ribosylglycohydrolase family protein [Anaerolineae bacterium]